DEGKHGRLSHAGSIRRVAAPGRLSLAVKTNHRVSLRSYCNDHRTDHPERTHLWLEHRSRPVALLRIAGRSRFVISGSHGCGCSAQFLVPRDCAWFSRRAFRAVGPALEYFGAAGCDDPPARLPLLFLSYRTG